jgi:hypothetical protein
MSTHHRLCPACDREFDDAALQRCPDDDTPLILIRPSTPFIGRTIGGRFEVKRLLGRGGMGSVYLARQLSVGRDIALKIMHPREVGAEAAARRFVREAKLCASLTHPNIVTVLDFGQEQDGTLFLAMEFLPGPPLDTHLGGRAIAPARAARIAARICDALAVAHDADIIHRDLKPENVIVTDPTTDQLKVVDFGLARSLDDPSTRITASGVIFGTAAYISPEMVMGKEVGRPADLYAVGVMLFEMLEGHLPFEAGTSQAIALQHATAPPPPLSPSVPAGLQAIVTGLLDKEPAARFPDARALRDALLAAAEEPGAELAPVAGGRGAGQATEQQLPAARSSTLDTRPPSDAPLAPPRRSRRPLVAALVGVAVVAVVAVGFVASKGGGEPAPVATAVATDTPAAPVAEAPAADPRPSATTPAEADVSGADDVEDAGTGEAPSGASDAASRTAGASSETDTSAQAPPPHSAPTAPTEVSLEIRSTPTATVLLDGERVGKTPLTLTLPPRDTDRVVKLVRSGYQPVTQTLSGATGHTLDVALTRAAVRPSAGEGFILPR